MIPVSGLLLVVKGLCGILATGKKKKVMLQNSGKRSTTGLRKPLR